MRGRALAASIRVEAELEQCIVVEWEAEVRSGSDWWAAPEPAAGAPEVVESLVRVALRSTDLEAPATDSWPAQPPKGAVLRCIRGGARRSVRVADLPQGCSFLISVSVVAEDGTRGQSPWVHAATRGPATHRAEPGYQRSFWPAEAMEWSDRERSLWCWTAGAFHPRQGGRRPPPADPAGGRGGWRGRVSVVTPTTESRQGFHKDLWACFEAQAWPDKELVVVETYTSRPSPVFAEMRDPRLVYAGFQRPPGGDWSIGLKRNICAELSSGEFLANFDDDDLYAPQYLDKMVEHLEMHLADVVTLSTWYVYDVPSQHFGFCDAMAWGWANGLSSCDEEVASQLYGYGFSYVYRRQASLDVPYDDVNMQEDFHFITELQRRKGEVSVSLLRDEFGISLHMLHGLNTSNVISPREVGHKEAAALDVAVLFPLVEARTGRGGAAWAAAAASGRQHREILVHAASAELRLCCAAGAMVSELQGLLEEHGEAFRGPWRFYCVPPSGEESEETREEMAASLLRLLPPCPAEHGAEAVRVVQDQMRFWLELAKRPLKASERLRLHVDDLWLLPAEAAAGPSPGQAAAVDGAGEDGPLRAVLVSCQRLVGPGLAGPGTVQVRLPAGASVAWLRKTLGPGLPATAQVLGERPGQGLVALGDAEALPDRVEVAEFAGKAGLYCRLTREQGITVARELRAFFERPEVQLRLDGFEQAATGSEGRRALQYRMRLAELMASEAEPQILRRYGLPEGREGHRLLTESVDESLEDPEALKAWIEVQSLCRNVPLASSLRMKLACMLAA